MISSCCGLSYLFNLSNRPRGFCEQDQMIVATHMDSELRCPVPISYYLGSIEGIVNRGDQD